MVITPLVQLCFHARGCTQWGYLPDMDVFILWFRDSYGKLKITHSSKNFPCVAGNPDLVFSSYA